MAQWTVSGADENTGKDRIMAVTAHDEKGAAKAARERGILCTEAKRVTENSTAAEPTTEAFQAARESLRHYLKSETNSKVEGAPGYRALRVSAMLLFYIGAAVAIWGVFDCVARQDGLRLFLAFSTGVILFAAAEALKAFRDLVRNSFKQQ